MKKEFLSVENISIDSNFFELGGDSLISIKIITKLSSDFDINLGIKDIFSYPTIASLSHYLNFRSRSASPFLDSSTGDP